MKGRTRWRALHYPADRTSRRSEPEGQVQADGQGFEIQPGHTAEILEPVEVGFTPIVTESLIM